MSPIQRQTTFGPVVGTDLSAANGTYVWKGVPYAKPPVGELRWKAPADPDPWTSPRLTQQFGHACAQASRLYGPGLNNKYDATIGTSLGKTVGSEDCLYLNIWRPASAAAQLPVIVWVHGGSNISGYTADPMYDGANLARTANAVVRVRELPARRAGLLQPRATEDRQSARRLRQLRAARHHQGAAVRPSQHRRLRRRSGQRHADGRVGRRRERLRRDDVAAARRCQSGARAQTAADERRHFAGERTARW